MIEVLVGAVVVVCVALALLDGLDGAQRTTKQSKARSVAATLAQTDQERLRSMRAIDLSNLNASDDATRDVEVAGVKYTVVSRAEWVRDPIGVVSCSSANTRYLRISSTATSTLPGSRAVTLVGLMSPPPGSYGAQYGTAVIKVVDTAGVPLEGGTVDLASSPHRSEPTNALGCGVFVNLLAGPYTATIMSGTNVGYDGAAPTQVSTSVTASQTTFTKVNMGKAARVEVTFDTKIGNAAVTPVAVAPPQVSLANSKLPAGPRAFGPGVGAKITAASVYPFSDGYGVYAGNCADNDPSRHDAAYWTANPDDVAKPAPGGVAAVMVRMPAIRVRVRNPANQDMLGARIFVSDPDCPSNSFPPQLSLLSGAMTAPAHPFGTYIICADDNVSRHFTTPSQIANTNPTGTATTTTLRLPASANGKCP